ncbi:MAG: monofunctional biosynthetic peptidoglycan transglycosylase [Flavobacteriales bacterium]
MDIKNYFRKRREAKESQPKRSLGRRLWRFVWKSTMWFFIVTIGLVFIFKWVNPPITIMQIGERCDCPEGSKYSKGPWVDYDEIALSMKLAVVASEDNNFMKHGGIDWGAVEKAKKYNETTGKKRGRQRGASTITQQTAKNVFLWKGTTNWAKWIRKGFEVYFTYLIEWIWGKERIMEVYLNVIEMGPCKFGVGAASKDYFATTSAKLSKDQAALIAACLPNPKKYSVSKPGSYMKKRQGQIVRLMRMIGDSYFERYGGQADEKKREKEEKESEDQIRKLSDDDLPEKLEEGTTADDEKDENAGDADKKTESMEPEIEKAEPDTSGH